MIHEAKCKTIVMSILRGMAIMAELCRVRFEDEEEVSCGPWIEREGSVITTTYTSQRS